MRMEMSFLLFYLSKRCSRIFMFCEKNTTKTWSLKVVAICLRCYILVVEVSLKTKLNNVIIQIHHNANPIRLIGLISWSPVKCEILIHLKSTVVFPVRLTIYILATPLQWFIWETNRVLNLLDCDYCSHFIKLFSLGNSTETLWSFTVTHCFLLLLLFLLFLCWLTTQPSCKVFRLTLTELVRN